MPHDDDQRKPSGFPLALKWATESHLFTMGSGRCWLVATTGSDNRLGWLEQYWTPQNASVF